MQIESLESRRLLTGAHVASHVLYVDGPNDVKSAISVENSTDNLKYDVKINWKTAAGTAKSFTASFLKSLKIDKIVINGGTKADTINVGQVNGAVAKTRVNAFAGADLITLGGENDVVYAGIGNDKVVAGGGNDLVYAGNGADSVYGNDGNDTLWGGNGKDYIEGNAGDDKLGGVLGAPNTLLGGTGKDTFVVKKLADNPTNDYNAAEDVLKQSEAASDVDGSV